MTRYWTRHRRAQVGPQAKAAFRRGTFAVGLSVAATIVTAGCGGSGKAAGSQVAESHQGRPGHNYRF